MALGCSFIWIRATWVAKPRLERAQMTEITGKIERVQTLAAKDDLRLTIATTTPGLPPRIRVSTPQDGAPAALRRAR